MNSPSIKHSHTIGSLGVNHRQNGWVAKHSAKVKLIAWPSNQLFLHQSQLVTKVSKSSNSYFWAWNADNAILCENVLQSNPKRVEQPVIAVSDVTAVLGAWDFKRGHSRMSRRSGEFIDMVIAIAGGFPTHCLLPRHSWPLDKYKYKYKDKCKYKQNTKHKY